MRLPFALSDRLSPAVRGLLLFALLNSALLPLVLVALTALSLNDGVLPETYGNLAHLRQEGDSWGPMLEAFDYVQEPRPKALYEKIFFSRHVKFQYPPSALLPLWLFRGVAPSVSPLGLLNAVSVLLLAASVAVSVRILAAGWPPLRSDTDEAALHAAALLLALGFYPLVKAYSLGQIQTWANGLFALALWSWTRGAHGTSGALVGAMCLVKPHYGLFGVWGVLRGRWRFVAALAATLLCGLGLSVAIFGLENHVDYLGVLSFMSRRGEAYFPNQSINGLLNRLLQNGNILDWRGASFAPFHPVVFAGTALTALLLVALGLAAPRGTMEGGGAVDFALLGLASTMASPIAWEHHYGILLPIYAVALPRLLERPALGRPTLACLAASYVLTGNYFGFTNRLAATPLNVLQSTLYLGAVLFLATLWAMKVRAGETVATAQP